MSEVQYCNTILAAWFSRRQLLPRVFCGVWGWCVSGIRYWFTGMFAEVGSVLDISRQSGKLDEAIVARR
ncbi:hypothetical protein L873DRAFT_1800712 [Choiromyces venosus 120613-1]|uniref:Uncharacterized protein n=1 Tax=Choiromyces venosus 120613-1 TaxID=1336337 RepID=A0A3N4KCC7_9PEZI|nr:hypothetical protein L873DRAFT_1800712 [Choiromyces venosus 120613-1]